MHTGAGSNEAHRCTEGRGVDTAPSAGEKASSKDLEVGHKNSDDDVSRKSANHCRRIQLGAGT